MKLTTCLLIDDDKDEHELFRMALYEIDRNFQYIAKTNCLEALNLLKFNNSVTPDYIFLDLNIPVFNGKECLKELKAIEHLKDVRIVIYSTSSSWQDIQEVKALGAHYYLTKPGDFKDLVTVLSHIFRTSNLPFLIVLLN